MLGRAGGQRIREGEWHAQVGLAAAVACLLALGDTETAAGGFWFGRFTPSGSGMKVHSAELPTSTAAGRVSPRAEARALAGGIHVAKHRPMRITALQLTLAKKLGSLPIRPGSGQTGCMAEDSAWGGGARARRLRIHK